MLNRPLLKDLMVGIDSKYTLVIVASKTARRLMREQLDVIESGEENAVSVALQEIVNGKISWSRQVS